MTFDHELVLVRIEAGENDPGDPIIIRTEKPVLCDVLSVGETNTTKRPLMV